VFPFECSCVHIPFSLVVLFFEGITGATIIVFVLSERSAKGSLKIKFSLKFSFVVKFRSFLETGISEKGPCVNCFMLSMFSTFAFLPCRAFDRRRGFAICLVCVLARACWTGERLESSTVAKFFTGSSEFGKFSTVSRFSKFSSPSSVS